MCDINIIICMYISSEDEVKLTQKFEIYIKYNIRFNNAEILQILQIFVGYHDEIIHHYCIRERQNE